MLVFHSHCQMANQMFIYACAVSLSKQKHVPYCISSLKDLKKFSLSSSDNILNPFKYWNFRIANKIKGKYSHEHLTDNFKDYSEQLLTDKCNAWYYGYFQGIKYLYGNEDLVKSRFSVRSKYKNKYQKWASGISSEKKIVAVHIRRSDYRDFDRPEIGGPDLRLPNSYYEQLLEKYRSPEYQIVFLSDDINEVQNEFNEFNNAVFSKNSAIIDLQILMHADVLILANSSFSWWGAFLNTKENKVVFVPKYFLGFKVKKEYPVNIIPSVWNQIEINE